MNGVGVFAGLICAIVLFGCSQKAERHPGEIVVPADVVTKRQAQEVASIWADGENQTFLLADKEGWTSEHWGIVIADFMRHAAKARAHNAGEDEHKALADIRRAFDAEWESPTDTPTDGIR